MINRTGILIVMSQVKVHRTHSNFSSMIPVVTLDLNFNDSILEFQYMFTQHSREFKSCVNFQKLYFSKRIFTCVHKHIQKHFLCKSIRNIFLLLIYYKSQ